MAELQPLLGAWLGSLTSFGSDTRYSIFASGLDAEGCEYSTGWRLTGRLQRCIGTDSGCFRMDPRLSFFNDVGIIGLFLFKIEV